MQFCIYTVSSVNCNVSVIKIEYVGYLEKKYDFHINKNAIKKYFKNYNFFISYGKYMVYPSLKAYQRLVIAKPMN